MKKLVYFICLGFVVLAFSACSSPYAITYATNPSGANIVCNGVSEGYSPVTFYYDKKDLERTNYRTEPCKAVWISGAEEYFSNDWSKAVKKFPEGAMRNLQRPEHPDLEKDMQFALEVATHQRTIAAAEAQAQATEQQAKIQSWQNINQSLQNTNQQIQQRNQQIQQQMYNQQMIFQMQQLNNNLRRY